MVITLPLMPNSQNQHYRITHNFKQRKIASIAKVDYKLT